MKLNTIPSLTWNWLHMNEAEIENFSLERDANVDVTLPEGVKIKSKSPQLDSVLTGAGEEANELVHNTIDGVDQILLEKGQVIEEPVRIHYDFSGEVCDCSAYEFVLKENASLTVIFDYTANETAAGNFFSQVKYYCESGAKLTIIQIQNLTDELDFINDIGGECQEEGDFHLIQLVLGGKNTYLGCRNELLGRKSNVNMDLGYLLQKEENLDVNYIVNHIGKKTTCDIDVNGVLKDRAKKVFRGTIDFKQGAAGSVGSELEDVLLMGDDITNQTIPVILCAEEDVEGNHGATIGELNEDLMFYLESRGNDRESIYEMMARARIDVIKNKIVDSETRELVDKYLEK